MDPTQGSSPIKLHRDRMVVAWEINPGHAPRQPGCQHKNMPYFKLGHSTPNRGGEFEL